VIVFLEDCSLLARFIGRILHLLLGRGYSGLGDFVSLVIFLQNFLLPALVWIFYSQLLSAVLDPRYHGYGMQYGVRDDVC
jgi:hypothetical protein